MVKSIFLQDGEKILVDDEDYERVSQYYWYRNNSKHGSDSVLSVLNGKLKSAISLQKFILEGSTQRNKNNDFRKSNLVSLPYYAFRRPRRNSSSKYKGVYLRKRDKKYIASIKPCKEEGKKYLGSFKSEEKAAIAYNNAVDFYWDGLGFKNEIGVDHRMPKKETLILQKRKSNQLNLFGIYERKDRKKKYQAQIKYGGKNFYIGRFHSKEEAALAYNSVSKFLYGNKAFINKVPMTDELKEFINNWEIPKKIKELKK